MATIVIDPGHGGTRDMPGSRANASVGPEGALEKALTLEVGRRVADLLGRAGHSVHLTRSRDVNLSAADRAAVARNKRAAVFLSIHFNTSPRRNEQGTQALVRPGARGLDASSRRLAEAVLGELATELGLPDGGLRVAPWSVLHERLHHRGTARCISEVS